MFRVWLNRIWFGIHNKVLNFHYWTLCYNELFLDNRRKWKSMDLSMDLWHSNIWRLSYLILLRIIVFELFEHWTVLIVFPFLALIISRFYSQISGKHDWTSSFVVRGPVKSGMSISPSVCMMHFPQDLLCGFFWFFAWGYFAIYTKVTKQ